MVIMLTYIGVSPTAAADDVMPLLVDGDGEMVLHGVASSGAYRIGSASCCVGQK